MVSGLVLKKMKKNSYFVSNPYSLLGLNLFDIIRAATAPMKLPTVLASISAKLKVLEGTKY